MAAVCRSHPVVTVLTACALALALLLAVPPSAHAADGDIAVAGLQTNNRTTPLGIGGDDPRFGWKSTSSARGVVQSAYEVRVGTSEGDDDVWSSGKVESAKQVDIAYGGPALESQTRYFWQVKVWDGAGTESQWSAPSWFETGLLAAGEWTADWIGASSTAQLDAWTDYTTTIDFTLGTKPVLGVYLRAKDGDNAYMWQINAADGSGKPKFRPHKKLNGAFSLMGEKDISASISQSALTTGQHTLAVTVDGSTITTSIDGTQIDSRTDASFIKGVVGFRQDTDEAAVIHHVTVTAKSGATLADADFTDDVNPFTAGMVSGGALQVKAVNALWNLSLSKPLLRKEFATQDGKTIRSARVYASGQGVHELRLNGEKVGDQHLAPGMTNYNKRMQSQTHDVTDQVNAGANAFGAQLGDGWFAGRIGWAWDHIYGTELTVIAQLRIDYTDGTHQVVKTDDTWKSHSGPWTETDNLDGESYDARLEQPGWEHPGYNAAGWTAVTVAPSVTVRLVPQPDEPVRTTQELPAKERTTPAAGAYVYDLGQNMVGVARMRIQGNAGQTVRIRYGEELKPNGELYTDNLRSAKATDHYTFKTTGTVVYEPTFTFHGFRYIEITGATTGPALDDVTGLVWGSDLTPTGTLQTSDSMLNQLVSNISWGQRGNFLSIPTDTPARDERLGYTGDLNVFAPTASYVSDTRAFLAKWLTDARLVQNPDGSLPDIAPGVSDGPFSSSGTGWEDAMITVPYAVWHAHADTAIVRQNYAAMQKFMTYLQDSAGADHLDADRTFYGDWLNLDDPSDPGVMAAAYFAENARMMSEMAAAIGEDADAGTYAALSTDVRAAFTDAYVAADGTVKGNSQTGYAMALGMKLVPESRVEQVGEKYLAKLKASGNHLTTGFLGTPWLLPALTNIGRPDAAYDLLLRKDYPSWGYEIANGATTMWERWDSIRPDGSFGDVGMNSFNHYAYGAVGDWMYQNIGGISAASAGYKKSRIAPVTGGGLTSGHGRYDSVFGTISSKWAKTDDGLTLDVEVPVNTTSEITIPAEDLFAVTEGGKLLADAEGVSDVSAADGNVTFTVGSGSYSIAVDDQRELMGRIIDKIEALDDHAGDLESAGDLEANARTSLAEGLAAAVTEVEAAIAADVAGDSGATTEHLATAAGVIHELNGWVDASEIDGPVKADLSNRLDAIEELFDNAVAGNLGVSVVIPPVAEPALPGQQVSGTVEIANAGAVDLSDLKATVSVGDWNVDPAVNTKASLGAGENAQLPFTFTVPRHQKPGTYDASVTLDYASSFGTFRMKDATPWISIDSGVTFGDVSTAYPVEGSDERATVTATLVNSGAAAVSGQLTTMLPDGWPDAAASERVTIDAGASQQVTLPLWVGLDADSNPVSATMRFADGGVTLATKDVKLATRLTTSPSGALDHVDFGEGTSETAHALEKSAGSGSSTEAGVTRRYSTTTPGQWFSAEVQVTPGQPFLVRNLETFDGARTKRYDIYVDGTLVDEHTQVRTTAGTGTEIYQLLVDDPAVLANDGTVRIRYEYPAEAVGSFDASIADTWVLPVPADDLAPLASASVSSNAAPGDNGWFRGAASVAVKAVDNRGGALMIETGESAGWLPYVAPVAVNGDGKHALSYRAKDAAGNSTGEKSVPVWIDGTAPGTQVSVTRGSGIDNADKATLTFAAQDGLSGVASTMYRVDGGDWMVLGEEAPVVEGFGLHTVEFFSTDVAGNPEPLRTMGVELADVDVIQAIIAPQVSGAATYGSTLTATSGSWNTKGLTYAYQWLRDGKVVTGRTAVTYKLGSTDIGHRLSVRVTASKDGKTPGVSTSAQTAKVVRAKSKVSVSYSDTSVRKNQSVRLSIRVTAPNVTPRGTVRIYENGRRVKSLTLSSTGKVSYSLKMRTKGLRSVKVVYAGSSVIYGSTSSSRSIRVR